MSRDKFYLSTLVGGGGSSSSNNTIVFYGRYGSGPTGRREVRRVHWKDDRNITSRTSETAPNVTPGGHQITTKLSMFLF